MALNLLSHLHIIQNAIYDARPKWYDIGIGLHIDVSTLKTIETKYSNTKDCLCEVITEWLKAVDPKPTWRALVGVLRTPVVDEQQLAAELEKKYCTENQGNDAYLRCVCKYYSMLLTQVIVQRGNAASVLGTLCVNSCILSYCLQTLL